MKTSEKLFRTTSRWVTTAATALATGSIAHAGVFYDESVSGDLSGNFGSPFQGGNLSLGANTISGTTVSGEVDYLTFTLPAGMSLSAMNLAGFTSTDDVAFLGLTQGSVGGTAAGGAGSLYGYAHFGTGGLAGTALVGTDILDEVGTGPGAQGFTPPLPSGTYTLWIQQTQGQGVAYAFDLTAVPEPADAAWAVAALLAGTAAFRHRQRRTANRQA